MAWDAYRETVVRFPGAGLSVDLRRPLGEAERSGFGRLGLPGSFSIVTACNPLGRILEPEANRRLAAQLDAVVAWGWPGARRADGGSPDGRHVEPGWALPGSLDPGRAIAGRFLQRALFWYDGDRFFIVPVHPAGPAVALPPP